jgi:hypothetical protein
MDWDGSGLGDDVVAFLHSTVQMNATRHWAELSNYLRLVALRLTTLKPQIQTHPLIADTVIALRQAPSVQFTCCWSSRFLRSDITSPDLISGT